MIENDWSYIGVFLTKESSVKLVNALEDSIPNGWKVYCHHMTIAFNDHSDIAQKFYDDYQPRFGENCQLRIVGWGISDKAFAVRISSPYITNNKIPHITVATSNIGKPVDSNYIQEWHSIENGMVLEGVINEFKKLKWNER